ncbi:TPA: HAMP domain-containing histidine kinase, partial [Candidatus Woesearchaeota archaeon]|nr:HAMP domain-containing histidine kinase [Candidatus Woesearchaeota archaeon]
VDQETNRLSKLISDILDLSRFEANKMKLELLTFDLHEIVANKLYLNMAKDKKIKVMVNVPRKFMVLADRDKIQQVFVNLFTNSLKFTPEGGTITVSAAMHVADWELSISDTGKGVHKDMIPKLFNKFYQADDIMTRGQGGMGLGLAIVKSIVELHKGKVTVESEEGKGTKMTIRLPRELIY